MLQFNPFLRPTAKQLLGYPIFEELRKTNPPVKSPHKIVISCDKNKFQYDYENDVAPDCQ
jgi:hypothetical protein